MPEKKPAPKPTPVKPPAPKNPNLRPLPNQPKPTTPAKPSQGQPPKDPGFQKPTKPSQPTSPKGQVPTQKPTKPVPMPNKPGVNRDPGFSSANMNGHKAAGAPNRATAYRGGQPSK